MSDSPPSRPFFVLAVDAGGCPYDVRVNDCPVISDDAGCAVTIRVPVNQWLRSGANILTISLNRSAFGGGACRVELQVGEVDDWPRPGDPVQQLELSAPGLPPGWDEPGAPPLYPPRQVKKHLTFCVQLPFARWRWDAASPRLLLQADRDAILTEAHMFWRALQARDRATIEALWSNKSFELAAARHQSDQQRRNEMLRNLDNLLDPNEWILQPLDEADLEFRVYAHGRLIHLVDEETGVSPLFFADPPGQLSASLDLFFYQAENGGWRIIR